MTHLSKIRRIMKAIRKAKAQKKRAAGLHNVLYRLRMDELTGKCDAVQ